MAPLRSTIVCVEREASRDHSCKNDRPFPRLHAAKRRYLIGYPLPAPHRRVDSDAIAMARISAKNRQTKGAPILVAEPGLSDLFPDVESVLRGRYPKAAFGRNQTRRSAG